LEVPMLSRPMALSGFCGGRNQQSITLRQEPAQSARKETWQKLS
jgi:hypothetical protein